ncbi:SMP-30/gluconolactonase/LRE family protein [Spirosoma areae]
MRRNTTFSCLLIVAAPVICPFSLQAQSTAASDTHRSKIAFQLPETGLITEGIAYDPQTGSFYVSSVHERKLIRYSAKREATDFSQPGDSLWGVFGLKIDAPRRLLWACSSALPQAKGITAASEGRTALVSYNLETNRLAQAYPVAADGKAHLLGDLTVASTGTVYSTDSRTPWIYRLAAGEKTVTPFLTDSLFRSLQGLAFSADEQTLYVADYRRGPLAVNMATRQVTRLLCRQPVDLSGIDGLYVYQNSLIAIQNRVKPFRIVRLHLAAKEPVIERVETLEMGHPLLGEPTLGVLVDRQFYYIANSQWDAFDEAGKPVPNYPAQKPTILVLPVN